MENTTTTNDEQVELTAEATATLELYNTFRNDLEVATDTQSGVVLSAVATKLAESMQETVDGAVEDTAARSAATIRHQVAVVSNLTASVQELSQPDNVTHHDSNGEPVINGFTSRGIVARDRAIKALSEETAKLNRYLVGDFSD